MDVDVDVRKKGRGSSSKVFNDADTKTVLEYNAAEIQWNIFFLFPSFVPLRQRKNQLHEHENHSMIVTDGQFDNLFSRGTEK